MIESMTGFGRSERTDAHGTVLVEVRSVNGRYLKVQVRAPDLLLSQEAEIEKLVRSRISRGTVGVTVHLKAAGPESAWRINAAAVRGFAEGLEALRPGEKVRLEALAALPGALEPAVSETDLAAATWPLTAGALEEALEALARMRRAEGEALARVLEGHLAEIERALAAVAARAPVVVTEWRDRLLDRVRDLLASSGAAVDEADLVREAVFFAERSDIAEEVNRLRGHLEQFREHMAGEALPGRTLDFLTQEMLREANTIASKANDAEIARHVVLVKGEVDRMKEQVQNVA